MWTFISVAVFILFSLSTINGDAAPQKILEEASKLEKAKEIFDSIKESDFVKTVKSVSKWGLPLLKSLNYFAQVIFAGMASESKELKYMKEQFKIINQKMDFVDLQFEEIKKAIDWNVVKVQYSNYEMSIGVLQDMIQTIADAPASVRPVMIDRFRMTYEQTYYSASDKLYESITISRKIFSENLVIAARKYMDDHKRKVEKFLMGNIQLIIKGLEVETFYVNSKNLSRNNDFWADQWGIKLDQITRVMEESVKEIENNWFPQLEKDTETFSVNNYQLNNQNYVEEFYKFLMDKFYWREWFVVVYDPISGGQNHFVSVYEGLIKFRFRNHNVVVGSRVESNKNFNVPAVNQVLNNMPKYIYPGNKDFAESLLEDHLLPALDRLPRYSVAAVIKWGGGVWYISNNNYRAYKKWEGNGRIYNIIVMG